MVHPAVLHLDDVEAHVHAEELLFRDVGVRRADVSAHLLVAHMLDGVCAAEIRRFHLYKHEFAAVRRDDVRLHTAAFAVALEDDHPLFFEIFGGKLFRFNLEDIVLASNANIGGPTTAAGMAISQGWTKLVGPSMLVGTFGYVIGTYLGIIVGSILGA